MQISGTLQRHEGMHCQKCRYPLAGLPAKRCDDCGHIVLRCPECGTPVEANEPGTTLLETIRRVVDRLPTWVQVLQMAGLSLIGLVLFITGWVMTLNRQIANEPSTLVNLCLFLFVATVLIRQVGLVFKGRYARFLGAWLFVMGLWGCAYTIGTASLRNGPKDPLYVAMWMLAGSGLGAATAPLVARLALWMTLKKSSREALTAENTFVSKGAASLLSRCVHCAAEVGDRTAALCPTCGLSRIPCPTCGGQSPASTTLPAVQALSAVGGQLVAAVLLTVRFCLLIAATILLIGVFDDMVNYWIWNRTLGGWSIGIRNNHLFALGITAALLRLVVTPGRNVLVSIAVGLVPGLIAACVEVGYTRSHQAGEEPQLLLTWLSYLVPVTLGTAIIGKVLSAVLPKRRGQEIIVEMAPIRRSPDVTAEPSVSAGQRPA